MIQASTRYLPHIVVLLAVAAVPTWLHRTSRLDVEDCADVDAVLSLEGGAVVDAEAVRVRFPNAPHPPARERFLMRASAGGRWAQGRIAVPGSDETLEFVVVRSFEAKLLYHWPSGRLNWQKGVSLRVERRELETVGSLPVHRGYYDSLDVGSRRRWVVAYLLVYEGRPVSNPYLAQLLWAPLQLVRGRSPMWLFFVSGRVKASNRERAEQAARSWLASVWERYAEACRL